jgi:formiminotetrahydrofolate cyclodeaminase
VLADVSLKEFLSKTASKSAVPGGGSIAALSAAIAASLSEMVANLTMGRKGFEAIEQEMRAIAREASQFREKLLKNIDEDCNAFSGVLAAYKLPKDTDQERSSRKQAIQGAVRNATLIPLNVAKDALKIMEMAEGVIEKGNKNAITDGAVAVMMARTAVLSALYNVKINLVSVEDKGFVDEIKKQIDVLETEARGREWEILSKVAL